MRAHGQLSALIARATEDAYNDSERTTGFYTMIEAHLQAPFASKVPGVQVTVEAIDLTEDESIIVICSNGEHQQRLPILDLPLPNPPPAGAEWIEAYRTWSAGRW